MRERGNLRPGLLLINADLVINPRAVRRRAPRVALQGARVQKNMTDKDRNPAAGLTNPKVASVLERLHRGARGDIWRFGGILPKMIVGKLRGKKLMDALTPAMARQVYMPVSREEGRFLYQMARLIGARTVVEFGTSFGNLDHLSGGGCAGQWRRSGHRNGNRTPQAQECHDEFG